jgi:hypothetical protein
LAYVLAVQRQNRTATQETIEIPISRLAVSDLAAEYLPPVLVIADSELAQMGAAGKAELARRETLRKAHVKAGRVRYVFESKSNHSNGTFWVMSPKPKGKERDRDGRLHGHACQSSRDGKQLAMMTLERYDEGGVIYIDGNGFRGAEIVDLRPNECQALKETGKHDWSYVPTGDDICRSCGLLI